MSLPDVPQSVLDLAEFRPVEDLLLALLREALPDIEVYSLIPDHPPWPFVLVRRIASIANWNGDSRFVDRARFTVQVFTQDPDADEKGSWISEAIRVALRDAWLAHRTVAGIGTVAKIRLASAPVREPDFATSTGPVQYADLPTGTTRYEAQYELTVRRPRG